MRPASLHYFADASAFARSLGRQLGARAHPVAVHRFPDGESRVRVQPSDGASAVLVRRLDDPNARLFEVLLAVDALRRAGKRRIGLVVPYMPYMRQDRVFARGGAISQRVLAQMLGGAVDEVITLEPHLHRIRDLSEVFPCATRAVPAAPLLAAFCARGGAGTVVVGPDEESEPWVRAIGRLSGLRIAIGRKVRRGDRDVTVALPALPPASRAVLVDDVASSGVTLAAAARAVRRAGVPRVDAAVVHAIFAPGAAGRLRRAGVRRVVSCDTVVHPTNRIATAAAFADAVRAPKASTGGRR